MSGDRRQLGFAYAAMFRNAHMVCDCAVPGTDSAICPLLCWAMGLSLPLKVSMCVCAHTHSPNPQPNLKRKQLIDFPFQIWSPQEIEMSQYLNTAMVRISSFMESCEVQGARKPVAITCKATQHGRWVIMTDGTSQKKKKSSLEEACWKDISGMSTEVGHEQCNNIAIWDDRTNT